MFLSSSKEPLNAETLTKIIDKELKFNMESYLVSNLKSLKQLERKKLKILGLKNYNQFSLKQIKSKEDIDEVYTLENVFYLIKDVVINHNICKLKVFAKDKFLYRI